MSQQQQAPQNDVEHHLYNLGRYLRDLATWTWLSIFFFWLIFPLVFLIKRKIQFLIEMDKLNRKIKDYDLERAFLFQIIGLIVTVVAFFVGWVFLIISYDALEKWGKRYANEHPSNNMVQFVSGMRTTKMGLIFSPIVIGLFIVPVGMKRAGNALMVIFGGQTYSIQNGKENTTASSSSSEIELFRQEVTGYRPKFCLSCGNPVEEDLKFCKNCGTPL
ncbi:MAG: zinc ribbon domain-containing protein [Candidatus Lokiarchaeota archaeon]|nr:zinc ribbon domain-containing protein [Candidatus Lokiarchaeota archaeon]